MFEKWDHLWSKSGSSSFDLTVKLSMRLWHYLPKRSIFFTCLWSFISRTVTLWIKVGIVDVKDNFHLTSWNLWSSDTVPEAELISVLRSAPELEIWTHNTPGWIPALSSPWLFTLTGYETLQDLSLNAKLISYLGSTTVSSSCRHNTISEARVKLLKKSTVTTTMTE